MTDKILLVEVEKSPVSIIELTAIGPQGIPGVKGDVGDLNPQMSVILADAEAAKDTAQASAAASAQSASEALGHAAAAADSATSSYNSAAGAAISETSATNSANTVSALLASFRGVFLGAFISDVEATSFATTNNITLNEGVMYENTTADKFRIYSNNIWVDYDASAQASQSAAALSAANAATSASNASNSATSAGTFAAAAETSATNAANSATSSETSAVNAANSANSASIAGADAGTIAGTAAGTAAASPYAAAANTSALASANSASSAEISANNAASFTAQALQAATQAQGFASILNTAPSTLPYEVIAVSGGVGTGTGGTDGTYNLGVSGGPAGFNSTVTISGGKIASYAILNHGISTSNTAPTLSLSNVPGLTGATIPTATVGIIPVNRVFTAPDTTNSYELAWINNAGTLSQFPTTGTQFSRYYKSSTDTAITTQTGSLALDDKILKGTQTDYTVIGERSYSALYNGTSYSFSAAAAAGTDIVVGEVIETVGLNVQTVSATPPVSAVLILRERALSASDLNTTAVSTGDTVLETLNLNAAALTALGLTGSASATNLPFVRFALAGRYVVRSGYAYSFQLTFYDAASGGGNRLQVYAGSNSTAGIDQYRRGYRLGTAVASTWTTQADTFGIAWRFSRRAIPDVGDVTARVTLLESQKNQLTNGIPLVSYLASSVSRTGFFSTAGAFYGWSFVLDVGGKLTAKMNYETLKLRLSTASPGTIKLYAYKRPTTSTQINTAPSSIIRDRTLLTGFPITIDTSTWTANTETVVTINLPQPFVFQAGESIEFAVEAFDNTSAAVKCSSAYGATASTQHERGWYRSAVGNVGRYDTAIASNAVFFELTSQMASVSVGGGGGSSSVSTYGGWAITAVGTASFTSSTLTIATAGSTLVDATGNSYSFGSTISGVAATAVNYKRYDGVYVDSSSLSLVLVPGTARSDSAAEWPPSRTAGTQLLLGYLAVGSSGIYDFIPRWDVVAGLYRTSMQDDFIARQREAKRLFEPVMNILVKGGSINVAIDGDSITQLGVSGATADTPNGVNRDKASTNYLNTNLSADTIAAANIQTYTDASGTHDAFGLFREFWGVTVPSRFNATVTASNFGMNGQSTANGTFSSHTAAIAASLSSTAPCVFHIAWGMNDLMSGTPTAAYNNLLTEIQAIQTACPNVVVIVHGVHRPNDGKTSYTYSLWLAMHNALEQAALKAGAIFVPNWAGYEINRGIIGIAGVDRCTANLNTAVASNHPGIREHRFMRDLFKALVL